MMFLAPAPSLALLRPQHDLVDEVDDGGGWLLWVEFGEQVTHVLRHAAWFLSYKPEHSRG